MHQANLDAEIARILINGAMNLCARPSFLLTVYKR